MCIHNGNFYLVSTDDMAMQGARVSATMEMSHFSWNIPIPATEGFLKIFFLLVMCIEVRFNVYAFCTETDIHGRTW